MSDNKYLTMLKEHYTNDFLEGLAYTQSQYDATPDKELSRLAHVVLSKRMDSELAEIELRKYIIEKAGAV